MNSTSLSAKVSKIYDLDNLKQDIEELRKTGKETNKIKTQQKNNWKKLNETKHNVNKDEEIVDNILEKLANIEKFNKTVNEILDEAKKYEAEFENIWRLGNNTSKICQQAQDKYNEFENIVNGFVKSYDDAAKNYENEKRKAIDINNKVDKVYKRTLEVQNEFDKLKLPLNVIENYVNDSEIKLNQTIDFLKNNSDLLKELLTGDLVIIFLFVSTVDIKLCFRFK